MEFAANQLLRLLDDGGGTAARIVRVLRISDAQEHLLVFDVEQTDAYPELLMASTLLAYEDQGLVTCLASDAWAAGYVPNESEVENMEETKRKQWRTRIEAGEKRAKLIAGLDACDVERLCTPKAVRAYVQEVAQREGRSRHTVLDVWRLYWRRGQTQLGLIPNYEARGGPGRERPVVDGAPKRGRKPEHLEKRPEWIGINITEKIKRKLQRGYRMFYLNSALRRSLRDAYALTCETFFIQDIQTNPEGVRRIILRPPHEIPTFGQFQYWGARVQNLDRRSQLIRRYGRQKFDTVFRPMHGTFSNSTKGPGWLFQIDSWVAEINLRAKHDRSLNVGKPIVYLTRCTSSRLITGLHVTLENRNYLGAALAIENAASEKSAFTERYGHKGMYWPSKHLPQCVLADWGELGGKQPNHWVKALGLRLSQTPPRRPNLKALIEATWAQLYLLAIRKLPGSELRDLGVEDPDPQLNGLFTLDEFIEALLGAIDVINNTELDNYDLTQEMIADGLKNPSPMDLWEWGVANSASGLRVVSSEMLRLHLLPGRKATITPYGLDVDGVLYGCERAVREEWYIRAQERRVKKGNKGAALTIDVAYDPRNMSVLYLRPPGQTTLEACTLKKPQAWANRPWAEYRKWLESKRLDKKDGEAERRQRVADQRAGVRLLTETAKAEAVIDQLGKSKKDLVSNSAANRQAERVQRGIEEALVSSVEFASADPPRAHRTLPTYIAPPRFPRSAAELEEDGA